MKASFRSLLMIAAALSLSAAGAEAQTANSSPTAPAGGNASGGSSAAGASSTAGPSTGEASPKPGTSKIGAPTAAETEEQRRSNQATTICKGC